MQRYNKAIVAVLGGVVALASPWIPGISTVVTPEIISSLAILLTPVFVYFIPNRDTKGTSK